MLWCVTEKLSLGELTRVQGVSQKFPIGVVNWEILSFGAGGGGGWAHAIKAHNGVQGKAPENISYLALIRP